jgi:hypothetical protein
MLPTLVYVMAVAAELAMELRTYRTHPGKGGEHTAPKTASKALKQLGSGSGMGKAENYIEETRRIRGWLVGEV